MGQESEAMSGEGPITQAEMVELFGEEMPIEAVRVLWGSPDDWTIGMVRAEVRRIAVQRQKARATMTTKEKLARMAAMSFHASTDIDQA